MRDDNKLSARPRCPDCGDVVGVYEPVVWATQSGERKPTRSEQLHRWHLDCFDRCFEEFE